MGATDIKLMVRGYYKIAFANNIENFNKMDKLPKLCNY